MRLDAPFPHGVHHVLFRTDDIFDTLVHGSKFAVGDDDGDLDDDVLFMIEACSVKGDSNFT